ncbi:hypothetical protein BpHYR1_011947 [Brachionus plicatilis]|uniref:Uncharacterized protein n=1 Tax=Brachionus plicatilis TaxID=10195 RepID=A0A3M7T0N5_BRAPC|nr:hypothetical protein BpHYR1_011947 [Brachionus plicatilis]
MPQKHHLYEEPFEDDIIALDDESDISIIIYVFICLSVLIPTFKQILDALAIFNNLKKLNLKAYN